MDHKRHVSKVHPRLKPWATAEQALLRGLVGLVGGAGPEGVATGCSDDSDDKNADEAADSGSLADTGAIDAVSPDAATGDSAGDGGADGGAGTCPKPADPPAVDAKRNKFAMSLFHYNIEYVIGGLDYTDASGKQHVFKYSPGSEGWVNDKVEDWIVQESLLPILQLYDKHPGWGVDIELQAYMVEVMADRHPETLALLRKLAVRGQVELISFHYAAQLFLAFPAEDLERSLQATREVFDKHCLPLSGVVFNQEGQAGEGRQKLLVKQGYEVGVYPKNLWAYVQHGRTPWPWYDSEGGTLIVGPGGVDSKSGVQVAWDFFDDGELRAVKGNLNPYFAPLAGHDPKRVKEFEDKLAKREKDGWHMTTVSGYLAHLKAKKIEKKKAPPLVDGTWQAKSTQSIHRWLGGRSDAFAFDEEDNKVRTLNMKASFRVRALQRLVDHADKQGKAEPSDATTMRKLWRMLWHAEVSDCSGVNPWRGEVLYGIDTSAAIIKQSQALRDAIVKRVGGKSQAVVDLEADVVSFAENLPGPTKWDPVDAPLAVTIAADKRTVDAAWTRNSKGAYRLRVAFGAPGSGTCDKADKSSCDERRLAVEFPRLDDKLRYTPALIEDEVRTYALKSWSWQLGEVWLPLANGLIGLGPVDKAKPDGEQWWVIKWMTKVHVAARVRPKVAVIDFEDMAIQPPTAPVWHFEVLKGTAQEALARANAINVTPTIYWGKDLIWD